MQPLRDLTATFPRAGVVQWIQRAPARMENPEPQQSVQVRAGTGIEGEHHATGGKSKRQVTLIQAEHLPVVAALLDRETIDPAMLRRNIVVAGINLLALKQQRFRIGNVLLEGTGPCAPCSRMEQNLGPGGYNAMRGHGGICARVLEGGEICIGDPVTFVARPEDESSTPPAADEDTFDE